jgi:hypothetical protein
MVPDRHQPHHHHCRHCPGVGLARTMIVGLWPPQLINERSHRANIQPDGGRYRLNDSQLHRMSRFGRTLEAPTPATNWFTGL